MPFRENKWPSYCQFAIEEEVIQVNGIHFLVTDDTMLRGDNILRYYKGTTFYDITRGQHEVFSVQTKAELSLEEILPQELQIMRFFQIKSHGFFRKTFKNITLTSSNCSFSIC